MKSWLRLRLAAVDSSTRCSLVRKARAPSVSNLCHTRLGAAVPTAVSPSALAAVGEGAVSSISSPSSLGPSSPLSSPSRGKRSARQSFAASAADLTAHS